jgi:hypothetical protein
MFSQTFLQSISGVIYFSASSFSMPDPTNTTVYYRATEGQGLFVPLNSAFNPVTGQLAAELTDTGFGEYAFGVSDISETAFPPLLIEPESLQPVSLLPRVPPLVQSNNTYTVNQQLPVSLSWCPKGFAAFYALQISTNPAFSTLNLDEPYLPDARYTFSNALPGKTYYWRVNTYNDGGLSDWATSSFSTVPPTLTIIPSSIVRLPDGRLRFDVSAPGTASVRVLGSTNFTSWQTLQTLTLTNGSGQFTDASAATLPARYYRLSMP